MTFTDAFIASHHEGTRTDAIGAQAHATFSSTELDQIPLELAQAIDGSHLRAARALLDWPMPMLAKSGDLSLSTVKRLEENGDRPLTRSRLKAILALRRAGIRFILLHDRSVAVAVHRPYPCPDRQGQAAPIAA